MIRSESHGANLNHIEAFYPAQSYDLQAGVTAVGKTATFLIDKKIERFR